MATENPNQKQPAANTSQGPNRNMPKEERRRPIPSSAIPLDSFGRVSLDHIMGRSRFDK
jgi:hypothetical protein